VCVCVRVRACVCVCVCVCGRKGAVLELDGKTSYKTSCFTVARKGDLTIETIKPKA